MVLVQGKQASKPSKAVTIRVSGHLKNHWQSCSKNFVWADNQLVQEKIGIEVRNWHPSIELLKKKKREREKYC